MSIRCETCNSLYNPTPTVDTVKLQGVNYEVSVCPVCDSANYEMVNNNKKKFDWRKHRENTKNKKQKEREYCYN